MSNSLKVIDEASSENCYNKKVSKNHDTNTCEKINSDVIQEHSLIDSGFVSNKSSDSESNEEEMDKFELVIDNHEEDCDTSSGSIVKGSKVIINDDESRSSTVSLTSTTTHSQPLTSKTNEILSQQNSPKNHSDNENSGGSQNFVLEDDNSRSSFSSSQTKSSMKNSQPVKSDDENKSRSSLQNSQENQSQSQSVDLSHDNNSRSSLSSSQSQSKSSQPVKSDIESNSRSSFNSSCKNTPEKQSQTSNFGLRDDNDSESSFSSLKSTSTIKNSQIDNEIIEDNSSRSSLKSSSIKNSPEKLKKYYTIIDSDSEDEIIQIPKKPDFEKYDSDSDTSNGHSTTKNKSKIQNKRKLIDSDTDEEDGNFKQELINNENKNSIEEHRKMKSKINDLIDSDSENEIRDSHAVYSSSEENKTSKSKGKKPEKKRMNSARASKDAAMREIRSETQRLIRESRISLPYHRPKQRTLEEFLNRKKVLTEFPQNLSCAEKVKMLPELISKVVEEKEKEAEMFYKSSDSEEDDKNDIPMETNQSKNDSPNKTYRNEQPLSLSDVQQNLLEDKEEPCNESIINLKQNCLNQGVVRNLFAQNDSENIINSHDEDTNSNKKNETSEKEINEKENIFNEGMNIDVNEGNSKILEEKVENSELLQKLPDKIYENSTEDIVLNMSETEPDNSKIKISEVCGDIEDEKTKSEVDLTIKKNNSDSTVLNHTSVVYLKDQEQAKINEESNELEDPILKLAENIDSKIEKEKILDYNVLRDDFGLPPEFGEPGQISNLKKQIQTKVLKRTPKIRDLPGSIIDFSSADKLQEGALELRDRFFRHYAAQKPKKEGISENENVAYEEPASEVIVIQEEIPFQNIIMNNDKECKPGEKLRKLKEELKRKIVIVKNEEWKNKENEKEAEEEEGEIEDDFYEGLPDEEEILDDDESAESEPEEDDIPIVEKRRLKCEFGDDEAEESDIDEDMDIDEDGEKKKTKNQGSSSEDDGEQDEEESDEEESDEEEDEKDDDDDDDDDDDSEEKDEFSKKPKKLKRIIKPFDEDSDSAEIDELPMINRSKPEIEKFSTQAKKNGKESDNEMEAMQDYQPQDRNQACKTPLLGSNSLSLISPVAHLTALNTSLESAKKSASKTSNLLFENNSVNNTPTEADRPQLNLSKEKILNLQKKLLFDDVPDNVDDSEIMEICSGQFSDTQSSHAPNSKEITDSQLMELCSGVFASQSMGSLPKVLDETSQDIILTLDEDENDDLNNVSAKTTSTVKQSDESMFSNDSKSPLKPYHFNDTQKKQNEVSDSQILGLCSGKFASQVDITEVEKNDSHLPTSSEAKFKSPFNIEQKTEKTSITQNEENEITDSQLMNLCSGEFTTQINDLEENNILLYKPVETETSVLSNNQKEVTDSQIINICSGVFDSQQEKEIKEKSPSQITASKFKNKPFKMDSWVKKNVVKPEVKPNQNVSEVKDNELIQQLSKVDDSHNNFELILDENSLSPKKVQKTNLISSEKKKIREISKTNIEKEEEPEAPWSAFRVLSSSDEDEENKQKNKLKKKKLKKKKVKMLQLSDDEGEEEKEFSDEEESEIEMKDDEEKYVDYDSEENEVVVVPKNEIKKVAAKFLENEAELSESEWESDDEDEQGLDKLDFEEADAEDIDEEKVKNQLDKIRMKQVMDEDQRDVKMLQEILFDDGDLHSEGGGRERKFKWKNIDSLGLDEPESLKDETGDMFDDEVDAEMEAQIRKMKYEKQKFLEEKEKSSSKEEILNDDFGESQIFKMGMKVISIRSTNKSNDDKNSTLINTNCSKNISVNNVTTIKSKSYTRSSFSFNNAKGSFLARGEESLIRIGQNLKESKKINNTGRKGNFVFKTLSPSVADAPMIDSEQENDTTPAKDSVNNKRKRRKFLTQTPTSSKKPKIEDRALGKKLF